MDDEAVPEAKRRGYARFSWRARTVQWTVIGPFLDTQTLGAPRKIRIIYFVQKDSKHMALNLIDTEDAAFIPTEM